LQALVRKDLIRATRPAFAGDVAYRFRHILIRDAAYDSIPKVARALLHERHADWLERTAGERALEFEEILGYHLEQAFHYRADVGLVDDEARQVARRAATRLGAAGRRAFTRIDAPAGVNLISRAIALLSPDDQLRIDLVPNVRSVQGMADVGWAESILNEAIISGDERLRAHARVQQGFLRLFFGSAETTRDELTRVAREAITVFERYRDDLGLARAWRLIAQAEYLGRRGGASSAAALHALDFARRAGDRFENVETVDWLGVTLVLGPTPAPEGARLCERLLREAGEDPILELSVLAPLAYLVGIQGRTEDADALLTRGRAILDNLRDRVSLFSVMLGFYFAWASEPAAAERDLRPIYEGLTSVGGKSHIVSIASLLAQTVYAQARYDEADELAREAEEAARPNDVHSHIVWRGVRAKVFAQRGEFDTAEALGREAVRFAESSDFLQSHAEALVDLAEVLTLAGRPAEAVPHVEKAIQLHEEKGNVLAVERVRVRLDSLRAFV
jgi:tetratricopeptide (TPR) repeat protein